MFDKNSQRLRAEQFAMDQLAKGVKAPVIPPLPPKLKKKKVPQAPAKNLTYDPIEAVNDIGQTLKPGMKVVVVSTGYNHSIKTRVGTFKGVRKLNKAFVVEAPYVAWSYFLKGTDTKCDWRNPNKEYRAVKGLRNTTLPGRRVYAIP